MSKRSRGGRSGSSKNTLTEDEVDELKEAFNLFDNEGKGSIDVKDLKTLFLTLGITVRKRDVKHMMKELDKELATATSPFTLDEHSSLEHLCTVA